MVRGYCLEKITVREISWIDLNCLSVHMGQLDKLGQATSCQSSQAGVQSRNQLILPGLRVTCSTTVTPGGKTLRNKE